MKTEWTAHEIKAFRLALRMTQTEFAEAIGVNRQQTVSEHECGVKPQLAHRILLGQLYERHGSPTLEPSAEHGALMTGATVQAKEA